MSDGKPRIRDLRERMLSRLRNHPPLVDALGQVDSIDVGSGFYGSGTYGSGVYHDPSVTTNASRVIVPAFVSRAWHEDDGAPKPPDVVVHVMVRTGTEEPRNLQTEATYNVQIGFEYRPRVARKQLTTWPDDVLDAIAAVGNERIGGWYWDGETGGTDPTFDDSINRFVAGKTFEIRRIA